ncbi:MAG: glycosyltransferase family 4 protein [Alphaproteobacteria bacterium]|nr:MAG: glycosyltransferase family 4 protein [Alphaproteobacteria bacterium]
MPKTAIFQDYFLVRGGAERLVLTLAEGFPGTTLVHGYRTGETYPAEAFPDDTRSLELPHVLRRRGVHLPALALAFAAQRRFAAGFDLRIFSGVVAPLAAPARGRGLNVFYCHTPPRFLYDLKEHYRTPRRNPIRRAAREVMMAWFEARYRAAIERMDVIVANSETVRERIRRYLGRDSVVVYPPIDTDRFKGGKVGDYFLSTARLEPLKRVDCIIEAFRQLPEERLVVLSGGSERARLEAMAEGHPNITFRGWVEDEELAHLVGGARATIYVPQAEDFGMSPVESMAAGTPVIGVAEGGLRETIVDGETGVLLPPDFTTGDLVAAVRAMTPDRVLAMRGACEARAARFSRERFLQEMRALIEEASRR